MNTLFWGPSAWGLIHSVGLVYPKKPTQNEKELFFNFFDSLKYVIPCKHCKESYSKFYLDIDLDNLLEWTYLLHNKVNDKLRKQGLNHNPTNISFNDAKKLIKNNFKNAQKNNNFIGIDFLNSILMNLPNELSDSRKKKIDYFLKSFNDIIKYFNIPIMDIYSKKMSSIKMCNSKSKLLDKQFEYINICNKECVKKGLPGNKCYDIQEYKEIYKRFVASCGKNTCR